MTALTLRNARLQGGALREGDVLVLGERVARVAAPGTLPSGDREADLCGRLLLPGLVNAHDHLDFSTFPPLGRPPYASLYEWAVDVDAGKGDPRVAAALSVAAVDRLFLGGLRNLLAGATAVVHHGAYHRSLGRAGFPVRVLARYGFAHSPGLTPDLRRTYRSSDRRIPWLIHAAEGNDAGCRGEVALLAEKNLLRQNTVLVHGIGVSRHDAERIAAARSALVWCPESNRHLYGATAPLAMLRTVGVKLGLGSDSPVSGVRDALSNLAAARSEAALSDEALLELATRESAAVARLPVGGLEPGAPADLIAVDSLERLLRGERAALGLVMVSGRALYGDPALLAPLLRDVRPLEVDGVPRVLEGGIGRRAAALLRRPAAASWLAAVRFELG